METIGLAIALLSGLLLVGLIIHAFEKSEEKGQALTDDTEQPEEYGSYLPVQFQEIGEEHIEYSCKHAIDLLHNSLWHGEDGRSSVSFAFAQGFTLDEATASQYENYLVGAFETLIAHICTCHNLRFFDFQREGAFFKLANQLVDDKPRIYDFDMSLKENQCEGVKNRLLKCQSKSQAYVLGMANSKELIKHLTEKGPVPNVALLKSLLSIEHHLKKKRVIGSMQSKITSQ